DRRVAVAGAQGRTRPACATARGGAGGCLWAGQSRARGQAAGGRHRRQSGIPAAAGRGRTGRRRASAALCRRCRAVARWPLVGARRPHPSALGRRLCAENRLALSRAMPEVYRGLKVERLAPFFQAFQAELSALNRQDDSRVCVLTPGPMNETYFEHAYLARYLGFLLVEGEDLTVRDDGVFIRTVSGLKRAEVLVRRLDA